MLGAVSLESQDRRSYIMCHERHVIVSLCCNILVMLRLSDEFIYYVTRLLSCILLANCRVATNGFTQPTGLRITQYK